MPWYHHLNPYAIGPFPIKIGQGGPYQFGIRWYGLAYLLGFVLAYFALAKAAQQGRVKGLKKEMVENLIFAIVIGVLVGGRIGYCVQYMPRWIADPMFVFKINEGGMAFFGGISGVLLALGYFMWKFNLDLFELGDVLAPISAFALGIGRLANFVNGELYGKITGSNWGVIFPSSPAAPRHPSQLYDFASHMLLALILWLIYRTPWGKKRGVLGCTFMILYGLFRVVTEIWREQDYYVGPFSGGQIASLILTAVGIALYFFVNWLNNRQTSASVEPS